MSLFRYIRRRKYLERVTLTAEGFAYLTVASFLTIGSVLRNVNLLILMTGIMLAPLFINWRLAVHRVRSLRGRRKLPSRIHANQMVSVQWTCENLTRFDTGNECDRERPTAPGTWTIHKRCTVIQHIK